MKCLLMAAAFACAAAGPAHAQQTSRVIDTAPNDVLNVREYPTTGARIVGVIPPDDRGTVANGERNGNWVFDRYRKVEGQVLRRFVNPEAPPICSGRSLDTDDEEQQFSADDTACSLAYGAVMDLEGKMRASKICSKVIVCTFAVFQGFSATSGEVIAVAECKTSFGIGRSSYADKFDRGGSRVDASAKAVTNCIANSPEANTGCCKIVGYFDNTCVSLGVDKKTGEAIALPGDSKADAKEAVLEECPNCIIKNTACAKKITPWSQDGDD